MSCFDEKKLYEYLDGILDIKKKEEVESHLKECLICQKKVGELKALEKELKRFWCEFRKKCPAPEKMYQYSLGKLSNEEAEKVSEHLKFCHICKMKYEESEKMAEEFKKLASSVASEEAVPSISLGDAKKKLLIKIAGNFNDLIKKTKKIGGSFEGIWRNNFPYAQTIGLKILQPAFGRAFERADVGEGFEKQVIQEEGSPFEIELDQFGNQLNIIFHTNSEWFKYSIVRFEIYEEEEQKFSGILPVIDGVGKYKVNLDEEDLKRPEKKPYKIKTDAISSVELLADLADSKSSRIFKELSKTGDAEMENFLTEIMGRGNRKTTLP